MMEQSVFDALGFDFVEVSPEYLEVRVPPWRSDITIEEDLIEKANSEAKSLGFTKEQVSFVAGDLKQSLDEHDDPRFKGRA